MFTKHQHLDHLRRALRKKAGVSIAETLVALLIVSLLTMGIATGVAFAARQYNKSVIQSESRVLCSTLTAAISDKLRNTTADRHEDLDTQGGYVRFAGSFLLPSEAYSTTQDLKAEATASYDDSVEPHVYTVNLKIYTDDPAKPVVDTTFDVIPFKSY